jgi:hypothetical protein
LPKSWPSNSYSSRIHPTPTASETRPRDTTDAVATCLATSNSGRAGATYTALENRSRLVAAAIAPINTHESGHAVSGDHPGWPVGDGYADLRSRG